MEAKVTFKLSGLAGPTSQFLNGTHELSELVLVRMALLMDRSRSVLPLRAILFFTPTSRWWTVTAQLISVKLYHKGYLWLFMVTYG